MKQNPGKAAGGRAAGAAAAAMAQEADPAGGAPDLVAEAGVVASVRAVVDPAGAEGAGVPIKSRVED